jgi:hypothetical protein
VGGQHQAKNLPLPLDHIALAAIHFIANPPHKKSLMPLWVFLIAKTIIV